MSEFKMTLAEFFLGEDQKFSIQMDEDTKSLKEILSKEENLIEWPIFLEQVTDEVEGLLDISIKSVFVNSWNKYRLFQKSLDKSEASPDEKILVPLAEHTIKSKYEPSIDVLINNEVRYKIKFTIDIAFKLKGFVVVLQNRKIKQIKTGECKGRGVLKCEGAVLIEKELVKISLPATIVFDEEKKS